METDPVVDGGAGDDTAEGFRPDRWDYAGAAICLVGVAVLMFAPRPV